jgi:hypothetical protein
MASSTVVAVADSAAATVAAPTGTKQSVAVYNPAGGSTVYLGGVDVTSVNGYPLGAGDDLTLRLGEAEALYARCAAAGSASLRILVINA